MGRRGTRITTFIAALAFPLVALATTDGIRGYSITGCDACHGGNVGGCTGVITAPATATAGETVMITVSVNGGPMSGGGINVSATAGTFAAGAGTTLDTGEIIHSSDALRTWTFSWTAPMVAGPVTLHAAVLASNGSGTGGDATALVSAVITVQAGGGGPGPDPVWGDIAPRGAPDGVVDIADVVLALNFAVGLMTPTADELAAADVAPGAVTNGGAVPPWFTPSPDGSITVGDVVVILRVVAGQIQFPPACSDPLPVADAGSAQTAVRGTIVTLNGSGSDDADTYLWTLLSRPPSSEAELSDATAVSPSFTADRTGNYTASLVVTNCAGSSTVDTVTVAVSNIMVVAGVDTSNYNAGNQGGGMRILSGRAQYTTNFCAMNVRLQGSNTIGSGPVTYHWEQTGGPPVTLSNAHVADPTFTAPCPEAWLDGRDEWGVMAFAADELTLGFRLTATASGSTSSTIVHVYMEDEGYDAQARSNSKLVGKGTIVYLEGAATEDDGDSIVTYLWDVVGPAGDPNPTVRRANSRVASFVPMVEGTYDVSYQALTVIADGGNGMADPGDDFVVQSASYTGAGVVAGLTPMVTQCGNCHDGAPEEDVVSDFLGTGHAGVQFNLTIGANRAFFFRSSTSSIANAGLGPNPAAYDLANPTYCWRCHTGWDSRPTAVNGGLDDVLAATGYEVPPTGTTLAAIAAEYPSVANMAGQQCESCHGPGSKHLGDLSENKMGTSLDISICGRCHHEIPAYKNSDHSHMYLRNSGSCMPCHVGQAFIRFTDGDDMAFPPIDEPEVATCVVCHDPHADEQPHQLRAFGEITMPTGETFDVGVAAACLICHNGRAADPAGRAMTSTHFAHHNQQGDVLFGVGYVDEFSENGSFATFTENSFHSREGFVLRSFTGNSGDSDEYEACVTCHMVEGPEEGEKGHNEIGGHSWAMATYQVTGTFASNMTAGNGATHGHSSVFSVAGANFSGLPHHAQLVIDGAAFHVNHVENATTIVVENWFDADEVITEWRVETLEKIEQLAACAPCHAGLDTFNRVSRADYDGDGLVEGIRDEITGLLNILGGYLVAIDEADLEGDGRGLLPHDWSDGSLIEYDSIGLTSVDLRFGAYNWSVVRNDHSFGAHNAAFAVQLVQKTYDALHEAYPTVDDPNSPFDGPGDDTFADAYPMATIR